MTTKRISEFESLFTIANKVVVKKPVAYSWQGLALKIIQDFQVPANKKSSVFKICKTNTESYIERCLNDTKELCQDGEKWKYFFKVINNAKKEQAGDPDAIRQRQFNFENYKLKHAPKKIKYN
ncbi:hypothetical protein ISS03_05230 [Patescibacteria group bacterium]|nr:hypothetical protein [Patescibacteria group bacterium]